MYAITVQAINYVCHNYIERSRGTCDYKRAMQEAGGRAAVPKIEIKKKRGVQVDTGCEADPRDEARRETRGQATPGHNYIGP